MPIYLGINSDVVEGSLLLGPFTATLALAKKAILVCAVLVEACGGLGLVALTTLFFHHRRLCHLHSVWALAISSLRVKQQLLGLCHDVDTLNATIVI